MPLTSSMLSNVRVGIGGFINQLVDFILRWTCYSDRTTPSYIKLIVLFSEQIRYILVFTHVINDTGKGVTIHFNFPYFFPKIAIFVGE